MERTKEIWALGEHDEMEGSQEIGWRNKDGSFCPVAFVTCYEKDDANYEEDQARARNLVTRWNAFEPDGLVSNLVGALKDAELAYNCAINRTPTGSYREKITGLNIERMKALTEYKKEMEK